MRLPYLFLWIIVALTFGSIFHGNLLHEEAALAQSPVYYEHHPVIDALGSLVVPALMAATAVGFALRDA